MSRSEVPVGVCLSCGALACRHDGERDTSAADFVCGMCDTSRLSGSAGLPPAGPTGGGGGNAPGGPSAPAGGGGAAAPYASTQDFEERRPTIAEQSREHRTVFRERIDDVLSRLRGAVIDASSQALTGVGVDELDPERVRETAALLVAQLDWAEDRGQLDRALLADAFGVAAWSIGAEPGEQPSFGQLRHLSDARMRVAIGRFTPLIA